MAKRDIVVVGASAGGVPVLTALVKALPQDFQGSVFIVMHLAPHAPSMLPQILSRAGALEATQPEDGESIAPGHIYVAPPDHHMLIGEGRIDVRKGPKENGFRPSVDALFRSAAYVYGPRVTGIVLSGSLDDGTSGLWSVKRLGGVAIVQEPDEALFPSMPVNVLEYVEADHILPVAEMGPLLVRLSGEQVTAKPVLPDKERKQLETEIFIAAQDKAFQIGIMDMGELTSFTCPHCHGVLTQLKEGKLVRFRCHTGHSFTMSALLAEVTNTAEDAIWNAIRNLQENTMLLNHMGTHLQKVKLTDEAKVFFRKAGENEDRARILRELVIRQEKISGDLRHEGAIPPASSS